jgi:hypothetical protein
MWRGDHQGQTELSRLNSFPLMLDIPQVIGEENYKGMVARGNPGIAPYAN